MAGAILEESRACMKEQAAASTQLLGVVLGGHVQLVVGPGRDFHGIKELTVQLAGETWHWRHLNEGSIVRLRSSGGEALAMICGLPREGKVQLCLESRHSALINVESVQLRTTGVELVVPLRAYIVCALRLSSGLASEMLPIAARLEEQVILGESRWRVVARFPVNIRSEPEDGDDALMEPRCMVWPGQELNVVEVREEPGYYTRGAGSAGPDGDSARHWLCLAEGRGWVYASKEVQGKKEVLVAPRTSRRGTAYSRPALSVTVPEGTAQLHLRGLNTSQRTAVVDFLQCHKRLTMLQGPPGSGKSQMIQAFLRTVLDGGLLQRGDVVLVSGPTNKAVHHLASNALSLMEARNAMHNIALAGVVERLPELTAQQQQTGAAALSLHDIFVSRAQDAAVERLERGLKQLARGDAAGALAALAFVAKSLAARAPAACEAARLQPLLRCARESPEDTDALRSNIAEARSRLRALPPGHVQRELLGSCSVLVGTLATLGRLGLRERVGRCVRWAIVDEASQPTEAETLLLLPWDPRKLLLVGDPQQLSATVVSDRGHELRYDRSLMGRLLEGGHSFEMLQEQYRMHPEIARFPARRFYGSRLRNAPQVAASSGWEMELWDGSARRLPPYALVDVDGGEESRRDAASYSNKAEACMAARLAAALARVLALADKTKKKKGQKRSGEGLRGSGLCLLTFYQGQVQCLQRELASKAKRCRALNDLCRAGRCEVHSVDSFQGSEAGVVLLSCVRTAGLGFLADGRRLNVALTRAQRRLLVLANVSALERVAATNTAVSEMLSDARQRQLLLAAGQIRAKLLGGLGWQRLARRVLAEAGGTLHWRELQARVVDAHPLFGAGSERKRRHFSLEAMSSLRKEWLSREDAMVRLEEAAHLS